LGGNTVGVGATRAPIRNERGTNSKKVRKLIRGTKTLNARPKINGPTERGRLRSVQTTAENQRRVKDKDSPRNSNQPDGKDRISEGQNLCAHEIFKIAKREDQQGP